MQKGNLMSKERVLLLVVDMASREWDGKEILTEADKHALSEGWSQVVRIEARAFVFYLLVFSVVLILFILF